MRKTRSDKKRDVKPTVSIFVKDSLYWYAYLIEQPIKDAGLYLIVHGLRHDTILKELQPIMISDYLIENRLYIGNREDIQKKVFYKGVTGKVSIKFPSGRYAELRALAFSLGITPTSTAALLIRKTLFNYSFMKDHKEYYLHHLNKKQVHDLDLFLKDIRFKRK